MDGRPRPVSLLRVLALVGILLLLGFLLVTAAMRHSVESHKTPKANMLISNLSIALKGYRNEYGTLPLISNPNSTNTVPVGPLNAVELNGLYQILIGNDVSLNNPTPGGNPRKIVFIEFKSSQVKDIGGGVTNIVDQWGVPIQVRFDAEGRSKIYRPGGGTDSPAVFGTWSKGPDGKDHPDPSHPDNADNFCSWK